MQLNMVAWCLGICSTAAQACAGSPAASAGAQSAGVTEMAPHFSPPDMGRVKSAVVSHTRRGGFPYAHCTAAQVGRRSIEKSIERE